MRCETGKKTIGRFFLDKNAIDLSPEYQRESNAWGRERKELFLDTLFNEYDVPKLYLHELPTNGGLHTHALVDGKQRLQCIWDFLDDKIKLAQDFVLKPNTPGTAGAKPWPKSGDTFRNLDTWWQEWFKGINLDVAYIFEAEVSDIEDMFFRLNNGEPLNAAETRNAFGGDMCRLVREVAEHNFFKEILPIANKRYQHLDLAARFLLIESGIRQGRESYCTLKKPFLDDLVRNNRNLSESDSERLKAAVAKQLNALCKIFEPKSHLLKKAGYSQLYYLFAKEMEIRYAGGKLFSEMNDFLVHFDQQRAEMRADVDEQHEANDDNNRFGQFERLTQQANDKNSLKQRVEFMKEFFLREYPGTKVRDRRRNFSEAERRVLYYRSGKKCAECEKEFSNFGDFEADHVVQWAHGGETIMANAQALCHDCNAKKNKKVA